MKKKEILSKNHNKKGKNNQNNHHTNTFLVHKHNKSSMEVDEENENDLTEPSDKISFIKFQNISQIENTYNLEKNFSESTEKLHQIRINYLNNQTYFDIKKRLILLDWMMEVSSQFGFKRQTYYLSLIILDIYFSTIKYEIVTSELQLIGVCCLFISSKKEEIVIPSVNYFAISCDNTYTITQILEYEFKILNTLNWKIIYPTLNDWANIITYQWDLFSDKEALNNNNYLPKFRNDKNYNDTLIKNYFLLLDIISLDYYSIFIHEKNICIGIIYYLIGICKDYFQFQDILNMFSNHNNNNNNKNNNNLNNINNSNLYAYKDWFTNICIKVFNFQIHELEESLNYIGLFFHLQFQYNKPVKEGITYEDNLQIQTHNSNNIQSMNEIYELRFNNNNNSIQNNF